MTVHQNIQALFKGLTEHELPNAIAYSHEPEIAPLFYRYIFYHPLSSEELSDFVKNSQFHITESLIEFYRHHNGLRINQKISIFGSLLNKGLQPICLTYGNYYERPVGLPNNSTVIGGFTLSDDNNGYLVSHENGSVTCTSSFLQFDEIMEWSDIETLIRSEINITSN